MIDEAVIFDMIGSGNVKKPIRDGGHEAKRALLLVMAGALLLGAAFLTATLLLTACSASVSSAIRADGGARISIQAEVPAVLASKFRKLASSGSGSSAAGPLFDIEAIRKSIAGRPSLSLIEISSPTPDSVSAVLSARSLDELAASPDIKGSGLLTISKGSGWRECRFRLERGKAKTIASFFPGIDPDLVEALSPPALEEDPVTVAEYKTMLTSVLGGKAMPAMESAALSVSLNAPGEVLDSGGGELSGTTLTARVPIIDALALEKPIELWIRWKSPQ